MRFFVVHTYTGREKRVKELLEKAIDAQEMRRLFGRVILPAERVTRVRKSKLVADERQLYPGYLVVEMEPSEETMKLVNSIPGVTHVLGTRQEPLPLTEAEVTSVLDQIERGQEKAEPEAPFDKGETVKVTKGPFAGFTGTVDEILAERRRVKVIVTIFGRPTPIDLDFLDVQPI
uniref:Transcription termination/antitermination protein NusG n=1 Tax=candidate division WOR-3 bacterium TaxID=2052148 RepID=A0A7C4GG64_UNCW3